MKFIRVIKSYYPNKASSTEKVGYRDDTLFGDNYTDAVKVLAYEIEELNNFDVFEYLSNTCFSGTEFGKKLLEFANNPDEFFNLYNDVEYFIKEELLPEISKSTGTQIHTVRWLCRTIDDVVNIYGADPQNVVEYPIGDVLLSDLGPDGQLWGYK